MDHREGEGELRCQEQRYNIWGCPKCRPNREEHNIRAVNCPWLHKAAVTAPGSRPTSPCFFKGASSLLPHPGSGVATPSPPPRGQGGPGEVQQPFGQALSRHCMSHTSITSCCAGGKKQMKPRGNRSCFYLTVNTNTKYLCTPVCFYGG